MHFIQDQLDPEVGDLSKEDEHCDNVKSQDHWLIQMIKEGQCSKGCTYCQTQT